MSSNYQIKAGFRPITHTLTFSNLAIKEGTEMAFGEKCHVEDIEETKNSRVVRYNGVVLAFPKAVCTRLPTSIVGM